MMPTVTFPSGSPATGTGPARAATPGCRGAPPCWCLTRTGDAASPLQLKTVKFQQPKHLHQERKMTTISLGLVTNLSSLLTREGAGARGGLLLLPDLSEAAEILFLSTSRQAPSLSTRTNGGCCCYSTHQQRKIPSDGFIPANKT